MKQTDLQLTGGNTDGKRRELDYYPTPANVTIALMEFLKRPDTCNMQPMTIWEPACGEGFMSKVFREYGHDVIETDLSTGHDFLTTDRSANAIITNPPFSLAEEFICKAVRSCDISAMLLKSQYWHASKRFGLFKMHQPRYVLPLTWRPDFYEHERVPGGKKGAPTMEVAWSVWIGKSTVTEYIPLQKP